MVFNQQVQQVWGAVFGKSVRYALWPIQNGDGTGSVQLTVAAGPVWSAWGDVIAAKDIATDFWVAGLCYFTVSGVGLFQVQLGTAAGAAQLTDWAMDLTAITTINLAPATVPYPIFMAANAAVTARIGGSAAKTMEVQIFYALTLW